MFFNTKEQNVLILNIYNINRNLIFIFNITILEDKNEEEFLILL